MTVLYNMAAQKWSFRTIFFLLSWRFLPQKLVAGRRWKFRNSNQPSRNWDNTDFMYVSWHIRRKWQDSWCILCMCSNTFRVFSEYVKNSPNIRILFCVPQTTLNSLYSPCMHEYCSHNLRIRLYFPHILHRRLILSAYLPNIQREWRIHVESL